MVFKLIFKSIIKLIQSVFGDKIGKIILGIIFALIGSVSLYYLLRGKTEMFAPKDKYKNPIIRNFRLAFSFVFSVIFLIFGLFLLFG